MGINEFRKYRHITDKIANEFLSLIKKQENIECPTIEEIKSYKEVALCYYGRTLAGVGAVKSKEISNFSIEKSNLKNLENQFEWELGYIYIDPNYQGDYIYSEIIRILLCGNENDNFIISTELSDTNLLIPILEKNKFKRYGNSWNDVNNKKTGLFLNIKERKTIKEIYTNVTVSRLMDWCLYVEKVAQNGLTFPFVIGAYLYLFDKKYDENTISDCLNMFFGNTIPYTISFCSTIKEPIVSTLIQDEVKYYLNNPKIKKIENFISIDDWLNDINTKNELILKIRELYEDKLKSGCFSKSKGEWNGFNDKEKELIKNVISLSISDKSNIFINSRLPQSTSISKLFTENYIQNYVYERPDFCYEVSFGLETDLIDLIRISDILQHFGITKIYCTNLLNAEIYIGFNSDTTYVKPSHSIPLNEVLETLYDDSKDYYGDKQTHFEDFLKNKFNIDDVFLFIRNVTTLLGNCIESFTDKNLYDEEMLHSFGISYIEFILLYYSKLKISNDLSKNDEEIYFNRIFKEYNISEVEIENAIQYVSEKNRVNKIILKEREKKKIEKEKNKPTFDFLGADNESYTNHSDSEREDYNRDYFNAITDKQYGDFDDFDGDFDSLNDRLGY